MTGPLTVRFRRFAIFDVINIGTQICKRHSVFARVQTELVYPFHRGARQNFFPIHFNAPTFLLPQFCSSNPPGR